MRVHYSILILFSYYSLVNGFAFPSSDIDDIDQESVQEEREKLISQDGDGRCTFEIKYG